MIDNCCASTDYYYQITRHSDIQGSISNLLFQAACRAGYALPAMSGVLTCSEVLKEGYIFVIETDIERQLDVLTGDVVEVCSNGTTRHLYTETGYYSFNISMKCRIDTIDDCP